LRQRHSSRHGHQWSLHRGEGGEEWRRQSGIWAKRLVRVVRQSTKKPSVRRSQGGSIFSKKKKRGCQRPQRGPHCHRCCAAIRIEGSRRTGAGQEISRGAGGGGEGCRSPKSNRSPQGTSLASGLLEQRQTGGVKGAKGNGGPQTGGVGRKWVAKGCLTASGSTP